jgi:NAD+ synthase
MADIPAELKIDGGLLEGHLIKFIKKELAQAGFGKLIVGLSGGVDSSVVAYLSAKAIGAGNVTAVLLPYRESNPDSLRDAELVIKELGVNRKLVDITPMVDAFFKTIVTSDPVRRGNKMARERMCVLYDISAELKALVIGTSNKSECLMGYGTLYGDLACALNPLGNLYKTHVYQLAAHLGVPAQIINKAPSADLWPGQTDEAELGITYKELDLFLYYCIDHAYDDSRLKQKGYDQKLIDSIRLRIKANEFKGRLPKIAELPKAK